MDDLIDAVAAKPVPPPNEDGHFTIADEEGVPVPPAPSRLNNPIHQPHPLPTAPSIEGNVAMMEQPQAQASMLAPSHEAVAAIPPEKTTFLDEEEEVDEVFVDEPLFNNDIAKNNTTTTTTTTPTSAKRKGRRGKHTQLFDGRLQPQSNQKSYWSSDDDSSRLGSPRNTQVLAKPRSPKPSSTTKAKAKPDGTPQKSVTFGRSRKTRGKRRTRRVQDDEDDGESSTEEEPSPQPKRILPALLNATNNTTSDPINKPPIAVVRTKNKTKSPKPPMNNSSNNNNNSASTPAVAVVPLSPAAQILSIEDMEICQRLDDEYENALEEREIGYMARYTSVRQSAFLSVLFMLVFLGLGTTFFMRYANWAFHDSLLFSIYTITTVGYGNHNIPKEMGFQSFTILYIFVGIATLTIMVAQVYQCIALEASRAQHSRDKTEMVRRGIDMLNQRNGIDPSNTSSRQQSNNTVQSSQASANSSVLSHDHNMFFDLEVVDTVMQYYEKARVFFTYNEYGRSLSVLLPFAGLILVGAVVVGPIEGWNIIEALYFAVVSLTTVGFGDYYPHHVSSTWFCIFWLPFSVGFMSMFLKNVATFYIKLSAQNINRIERRMRRRLARAKEQFQFEQSEALKRAYHGQAQGSELELQRFPSADSDDVVPQGTRMSQSHSSGSTPMGVPQYIHNGGRPGGRRQGRQYFDALPSSPVDQLSSGSPNSKASRSNLFGSPGEDSGVTNRRERILKNSLDGNHDDYRPTGQTMDTMSDVLKAVHKSISSGGSDSRYLSMRSSVMKPVLGNSNEPMKKPSFALRALVQERFAEIIATDIAGFQSRIEITDNTLSVTIDSLKDTADKWCVPRRARKAFRSVAFEALYFVGEHGLITRGADALYALTPMEFHGLFSPFLAAMGDAGTMEAWLASTEVMAEYDLKNKTSGTTAAGDLETGDGTKMPGRGAPTTSEKLHTATHKTRTGGGGSLNIGRVTAGNAFSAGG